MIEGALILLGGLIIGMFVGYMLCLAYNVQLQGQQKEMSTGKPAENPYEKYRNKDGLYSRKAVKESG